MNNVLLYCELVDARISASEKDLREKETFKLGFSLVLAFFYKLTSFYFILLYILNSMSVMLHSCKKAFKVKNISKSQRLFGLNFEDMETQSFGAKSN